MATTATHNNNPFSPVSPIKSLLPTQSSAGGEGGAVGTKRGIKDLLCDLLNVRLLIILFV